MKSVKSALSLFNQTAGKSNDNKFIPSRSPEANTIKGNFKSCLVGVSPRSSKSKIVCCSCSSFKVKQ